MKRSYTAKRHDKNEKIISVEDARHCAEIYKEYYRQVADVKNHTLDRKIKLNKGIGRSIPGMEPENNFFNDHTMHPEEMNIEVTTMNHKVGAMYANLVSSILILSPVGRREFFQVTETNTGKVLGVIRIMSPVIMCKPRNELLGGNTKMTHYNNAAMMGSTIVPVQPFGYNYLGGKLIAALCCTHEVRDVFSKKYNCNVVMFETTSLYGDSKTFSQYDGMEPYLRFRGFTDSDFIPRLEQEPYEKLHAYMSGLGVNLMRKKEMKNPSFRLKAEFAMLAVMNRSLPEEDKKELKEVLEASKVANERKRYYVCNYGIKNYKEIATGKETEIIKGDNYGRFTVDEVVKWWKKKATKRWNKLKENGKLRTKIEVWRDDSLKNEIGR